MPLWHDHQKQKLDIRASESSAKTTTEQTTQRKLYTTDESTFALELVQFMECKITMDISKIADIDLLKVAKQTSKIITN